MNIKQIFLLLKLRWWLVLALFALIVCATTVVSLVMPKQYTASSQILMDVKVDPLLNTFAPNLMNPGYMATQANIIQSDRVASRVVKMLGLADNPMAVEQWREATQGRMTLESYYGDLLLHSLTVEPIPQSSMMAVAFTGKDPKFAAAVTNAFTKAYLDFAVEATTDPAKETLRTMDDRMRVLRGEFQAAQDRLTAYQQKTGNLVATADRIDIEQQRLNALESSLATAMADAASETSKAANAGTETSVDVNGSGVVQGLKSQLAAAETKLKEVSEIYGSRHPQRMQLEAQVTELRRQLSAEMGRVSGTTATSSRIASRRVAELRSMIDQQKKTVLSMRGQRDEASVLLKDVETAQKAYETVAQRRTQLVNESQAAQAPARVLSPAMEPLSHSKPNIPKNISLAVIMGLLCGLAAAIGWEFLDRRVRSEDDMLAADGVPVLGVLSSKPLDARARILPAPVKHRHGNFPPQLTLDGGAS